MHTTYEDERLPRMRHRISGFTLVELLVLLAIFALLCAFLLPALQRALETSRMIACASNLHQHHTGAVNYATDFNRFLPVYLYYDASYYTNDNYAIYVNGGIYPSEPPASFKDYPKMSTGLHAFEANAYIDSQVYNCPGRPGSLYVGLNSPGSNLLANRISSYGFRYNSRRTLYGSSERNEAGVRVETNSYFNEWYEKGVQHVRRTFTSPVRGRWSLFVDHWEGRPSPHLGMANAVCGDGGVRIVPAVTDHSSRSYYLTPYRVQIDPYIP